MGPREVNAKSKAKTLGEAAATWEIADWTGPLAHLMRTSAECFVNVPITGKESTSEIKLRFHLKPYHGYKEPQQIYCEKFQTFKNANHSCESSTCLEVLGKNTDDIPVEFLVDTRTRSSGYSLLVDVLSGPDKFALAVSVDKTNGKKLFVRKDTLVKVNSDLGYKDLPVVDKLWRMRRWSVDQEEKTVEWQYMSADNVKDAQFKLNVTAYQIQAMGTDVSKKESNDAETVQNLNQDSANAAETEKAVDVPKPVDTENSEKIAHVILQTTDGMDVHVKKSVLIAQSEFFRKNLTTENCEKFAVPVDCEPLLFIVHWMHTGQLALRYYEKNVDPICATAKILEMDSGFWRWLEANLEAFFVPAKREAFERTVEQYNLSPANGLLDRIQFVKKKILCWNKEHDAKWEFVQRWTNLQGLMKDVSYIRLEATPEIPELSEAVSTLEVSSLDSTATTSMVSTSSEDNAPPSSSQASETTNNFISTSESDLQASMDNIGNLNGSESEAISQALNVLSVSATQNAALSGNGVSDSASNTSSTPNANMDVDQCTSEIITTATEEETSESNSGPSFNEIDNQKGSTLNSENDGSLDSFCVLEKINEGKAEVAGDELTKLRADFGALLTIFNKLIKSE